ncbi:hypothetical protein [Escherichia coli]|uniref:hypothetical protein n=1 Tax=Escherichia coli TaxID=562 RepID=UPI0014854BFA|nr:hypothetical protein [Escherichia coli]
MSRTLQLIPGFLSVADGVMLSPSVCRFRGVAVVQKRQIKLLSGRQNGAHPADG